MMIATPLRSFDRRVNAAIGHAHPHVDRRRRQKKGGIALQDGPAGSRTLFRSRPSNARWTTPHRRTTRSTECRVGHANACADDFGGAVCHRHIEIRGPMLSRQTLRFPKFLANQPFTWWPSLGEAIARNSSNAWPSLRWSGGVAKCGNSKKRLRHHR